MDLQMSGPVIERCPTCGKIKSAMWQIPNTNASTSVPWTNYVIPNTAGAPQVVVPYEMPRVDATQTISSSDMCWCGVRTR